MTIDKTIFILLLLIISSLSEAQVGGLIVNSKTNKPVSDVQIFLNQTSVLGQTNEIGEFQLNAVPTGFQEIILFKEGYELYRSTMKVQSGRVYNLNLSLTPSKKIKSRALTESERALLKKTLMGDSSRYLQWTGLEAQRVSGRGTEARIISSNPLVIENEATGLLLNFYLSGRSLSEVMSAPVVFQYLPSQNAAQNIRWEEKRKSVFNSSVRHFFQSLVANRLKEEGFVVTAGDSILSERQLVKKSPLTDYFRINLPGEVVVSFDHTMAKSRIKAEGPFDVNSTGIPINPKLLTVAGDMAESTRAYEVPNDYMPLSINTQDAMEELIKRFYERVYVQTDKPYYYPGEAIWFKVYVRYYYTPWSDSLSKTLYAELISPQGKVIMEKTLKVEAGQSSNDFILPDSLLDGTYYLRAYTNLQRNFGDTGLFVKPIPILKATDRVEPLELTPEEKRSKLIEILPDKEVYGTREKIKLRFVVRDSVGKPEGGRLSVAVTDAIQVTPVNISPDIRFRPKINSSQVKFPLNVSMPYKMEQGITIRGQVLNERNKPEKSKLTLMQFEPRSVFFAESDEDGYFEVAGFSFVDTLAFAVKAENSLDGRIEVVPRQPAPVDLAQRRPATIQTRQTASRQRVVSEYEVPQDVRLLEAVEVKATKIEQKIDRATRPYGKGDFELKASDIKTGYPNVLYSLVGKVAGLLVVPESEAIVFTRSKGLSILNQKGPLVTIDDAPVAGDAGAVLSMISPSTIESVVIRKRINVMYGSQGTNGVISVYLKKGVQPVEVPANFQRIQVKGYSPTRPFRFPDYADSLEDHSMADFRSTIYWNPDVLIDKDTGEGEVSFYAADLPGTYRIVVEGVSHKGTALQLVLNILVEGK